MSDGQIGPEAAQSEAVTPAVPATPPGVLLAARREELKLSVEQVANQLNLAPRQIQALEADNYGALPGMASVRGFIRAYAKLLKIDAEPLVRAIAGEASAATVEPLGPALSTMPFSASRSSFGSRRPSLKWLIAVLAVACVVILALAGRQAGWLSDLPESFSFKIKTGPSQEAAAPASEDGAAPAGNGDSVREAVTPPLSASPALAVPPAASAAGPAPAAAAPAPDINGPDMLVLVMREDSWIDVRTSDNTPLVSRLARAGETEAVKVTGSISLIVGNAAGVDVRLRGKPVELETTARSNVARVNLR